MIDLTNFEQQEKYNTDNFSWKYYKIMNKSNGTKHFAKVFKSFSENFNKRMETAFFNEILINSKLNHPSIIKFIGYSLMDFKNRSKPVIILEYASNKLLEDYFYEESDLNISNLSDTQKLIIIYGIASGMSYLHSHDVIHRSLNPRNIFIDEFYHPKITDFDFALEITDNYIQNERIKGFTLTHELDYFAPETLTSCKFSKFSDVYSFSLIMYQIFTNKKPFNSFIRKLGGFNDTNERPTFDEPICDAYKNLIERCWSTDPQLRPTFDQIINELKTNNEFITDKIDKEEYFKYIRQLEEFPASFESTNNIQIKKFKKNKKKIFFDMNKIKQKINIDIDKCIFIPAKYSDKFNEIIFLDERNNNNNINNLDRYAIHICDKEINNFFKHEIINFYRKLSIISQINHPSFLNFIGYSPIDFKHKSRPVIVTEFCDINLHGHIFSNLFVDDINWNDTRKLIIIYGIAFGMAYLHSHDIIHRDLKSSNIYLDEKLFPKIAGFDIAKEIADNSFEENNKIKGTPLFLAPEVYLHKKYSKSSDVYSFSLIMYEILMENEIFFELDSKILSPSEIKEEVAIKGRRSMIDGTFCEAYKNLIERCWSQDPQLRPSFDEIIYELETNPRFITDEIDKDEFFEYIEYLKKYPTSFDPTKRIKQLDEMISSRIHTFNEIASYPCLNNMKETEMNDLSFDYNYIDFSNYHSEDEKINGLFYSAVKIHNRETGDVFMLKHLKLNIQDLSLSEVINFSRELIIIPQLNHPSIIKFYGFNLHHDLYDKPAILIEYSSKGLLEKYINKSTTENELSETQKLIIVYGIASGMSYLHSHNILHRDLKPENILLDDSFYPKISGFNISKETRNKAAKNSGKIKGTPIYLASEVYLRKEYSKSSDVYSFSLIMYEIFTGYKPFKNLISPLQIKKEVAENGQRPSFNHVNKNLNERKESTFCDAFQNLIERCWSQDPSLRPSFNDIVNELKKNPKFITDKINKDEFFKYVNMIDNSQISFNSTNKILQIEYIIKSQKIKFQENQNKINIRNVYKTELNNVLVDYDFLNINDFEKQKLLHRSLFSKMYKIVNKKSKKIYFAIKYNKKYEELYHGFKNDIIMNRINNNISLNHPSIIKFVGYSPFDFKNRPYPIIVTEFGSNDTLQTIFDMSIKDQSESLLNDTKRLIILYGIASGMSYLHSHNFIHSQLKPVNVILDDFLFPKLTGFQSFIDSIENPIPNLSQLILNHSTLNENFYLSPEQQLYYVKSTANDVYAFAMIAYQLVTNEIPFSNLNKEIIKLICEENLRPKFSEKVPDCYRKLIEKCWTPNPKERPTFEEIVYHLKTNKEFINKNINQEEYQSYIDFIDKYTSHSNNLLLNDDFINTENKIFRKVQIDFKKRNKPSINFLVNVGSIDLRRFEKLEKIGSGGFGVVYKIQDNENDKIYAAKISKFEIDQCNDDIIINLSREINIISQLNHPAILQYIGYNSNNFKNKPKPVIVTEYASNGSLEQIINLERIGCSKYEWDDTKKLINIYGIASGMKYLHDLGIIHRDLKPGNILLDDFLFPKISDFGLSKSLYEQDEIAVSKKNLKASGFKGTLLYCAPEVIENGIYTKRGDVYAFGMIVYEIITSETPFEGLNQFQFLQHIKDHRHPAFKFSIPYCYRKLIEKCWNFENYKRPEFSSIVDILEKDKSFITRNVNEEEYLDYIYYIKEQKNVSINQENFNKISINSKNNEEKQCFDNDSFIDLTKYEKQEILNKGYFTKLYKFKEIKTGTNYFGQIAINKIKPIQTDDFIELSNELKIIKELKHPSLLKFIGYSPFDFKKQPKPVIVTEFAFNGSLENILKLDKNKTPINGWDDTKILINIYGIASGLSYLHSHNIIHRSLKPNNIFLDEILTPKIGDFGLSTRFLNSENIGLESISGVKASPLYSAPEVLQFNEYSKSSDVYSFSFIVYEIISNEIPFNEIDNNNQIFNEIVNKGTRPKIKESIPKSYHDLIEKCWSQNPNERPSFDEIVYQLKMDSGFITNTVNNEYYHKYIQIIDEQISSQNKLSKIQENISIENNEDLIILNHKKEAENGNIASQEFLAKKYSLENDSENTYKYFNMLINSGNSKIPLEFAVHLYKTGNYEQSFKYFSLLNKVNHPIAKYFIGIMKYYGKGCTENKIESFNILHHLSENRIDRATEFLENHF